MSLSTNNRELPSCRMLVAQTYTMITVVIVAITISLGLRMTTYLLAEPFEQSSIITFLLVLNLLRDVPQVLGAVANVVGVDPACLESSLVNGNPKLELRDLVSDLGTVSGKYPHQSEKECGDIEFGKRCHLFGVLR